MDRIRNKNLESFASCLAIEIVVTCIVKMTLVVSVASSDQYRIFLLLEVVGVIAHLSVLGLHPPTPSAVPGLSMVDDPPLPPSSVTNLTPPPLRFGGICSATSLAPEVADSLLSPLSLPVVWAGDAIPSGVSLLSLVTVRASPLISATSCLKYTSACTVWE